MKFITFLLLLLASCQFQKAIKTASSTISNPGLVVDSNTETINVETINTEYIDILPPISIEASKPKHQNILIIGDSEALYAGWQVKKVQQDNETVFVDSKPGTTIGWWNYGNFHQEMSKYRNLDIVIVFLGTNNFNFTYLQPYQNILDEIKNRRVKCIWVGPTAVYGKKHVINTLIKTAVSDTCTYVDTELLDIPLSDGVHPTIPGTIKWLENIWKIKSEF